MMTNRKGKFQPKDSSFVGHRIYARGIQSGTNRLYRAIREMPFPFSETLMKAQHGTGIISNLKDLLLLLFNCNQQLIESFSNCLRLQIRKSYKEKKFNLQVNRHANTLTIKL